MRPSFNRTYTSLNPMTTMAQYKQHTFVKYSDPVVVINEEKKTDEEEEEEEESTCDDNVNKEETEKNISCNNTTFLVDKEKDAEERFSEKNCTQNNDKSKISSVPATKSSLSSQPLSSSSSSPSQQQHSVRTKNILQFMFPPKSFVSSKDNKRYVQHVSKNPATSSDVLKLRHALNEKLSLLQKRSQQQLQQQQQRQPQQGRFSQKNEKEELYNACFDELIRQSTIENVERGLLYHKIKNELLSNIKTLKTLYVSSVSFGVQKAISARREKEELMLLLEQLKNENDVLNLRVKEHCNYLVGERIIKL